MWNWAQNRLLIDGFCYFLDSHYPYHLILHRFFSRADTCIQLNRDSGRPFDIFIRQTKAKETNAAATFTFHGRISGCKKKNRKEMSASVWSPSPQDRYSHTATPLFTFSRKTTLICGATGAVSPLASSISHIYIYIYMYIFYMVWFHYTICA